ncbi:MAG TPA: HEAT repeat domain-containing protein [Nannocystaceae bacterium]|nr:HEAT repeat domain-containing protein [Nannocystaceae bacterium]
MSESANERVQRVLDLLAQVRDQGLTCFGADAHGFTLGPVASEARVRAFEDAHGIALPEDYRAFLRLAGERGAGPYYGLYDLEHCNDFTTWICDDVPKDVLARPCPLRPGRNADVVGRDLASYLGTMTLGTQGCSYMMQLVVTGECRGRVVYVDADGGAPYVVLEPDFLAWYERWLRELLAGYDVTWFGLGPSGDAQAFLGTLARSTDDAARIEAARALIRIPNPDAELRASIVELVGDRLAPIRTCAIFAIGEHAILEGIDAAAARFDDEHPDVRSAAIRAVMAHASARHHARVLELALADPDSKVALSAVIALDKSDTLPNETRVRIVRESPHGGARTQAAWKVKWSVEHRPLLIAMLDDPDVQVRRYAIIGIRSTTATQAVPALLARLGREDDVDIRTMLIDAIGILGDASAGATLLADAEGADDYHRLAVVGALARLGDERVVPLATAMLAEHHHPVRKHANGSRTHMSTVAMLVRDQLAKSPSATLRALAT